MFADEAEEKIELMTTTKHRDCILLANIGIDSAVSCVNSVITASPIHSHCCVGGAERVVQEGG